MINRLLALLLFTVTRIWYWRKHIAALTLPRWTIPRASLSAASSTTDDHFSTCYENQCCCRGWDANTFRLRNKFSVTKVAVESQLSKDSSCAVKNPPAMDHPSTLMGTLSRIQQDQNVSPKHTLLASQQKLRDDQAPKLCQSEQQRHKQRQSGQRQLLDL